jgi:paraquat-inducible protein B
MNSSNDNTTASDPVKTTDHETAIDHGKVVKKSSPLLSLTWLFPLLASAAAFWFFWQNWKSEGPEIEIRFVAAPGIQGGKTPIIFRGVTVGDVTDVTLDKELHQVIVHARLKAFANGLARQNTDFWIDQPEISLKGATGITALIQGNSIQARIRGGAFDAKEAYARDFQGLEKAPLVTTENPGLIAYLTAPSCWFIDRGTPIYYHGVLVGMVGDKSVGTNGEAKLLIGFKEDYRTLVTTKTRFWVLPATSLNISPQGAQINIAGISALVEGALAMDQFSPGGAQVSNNTTFTLSPNEIAARAESQPIHIFFDEGHDLVPERTRVCYLGQPIGVVESAHPNPSSKSIDAVIRLESGYTNFAKSDTIFTLVSPKVTPHEVSGLETIVTGPYIACEPSGTGTSTDHFVGQTTTSDQWHPSKSAQNGLRVTLTAPNLPTLSAGSPVYYKGIVAGSVLGLKLDDAGKPQMDLLINPAFSKFIHGNSRFWRMPATSIGAASGQLTVDVQGLKSLIDGGIAFDTFTDAEAGAKQDSCFPLYDNEPLAKATSEPIHISFDNARGLIAGKTQVRYLGVPIGMVDGVQPLPSGTMGITVRFQKGYDFLRRTDTKFVLVQPFVSLNGGIKGIETLLSGIYIECIVGTSSSYTDTFRGSSDTETLLQENRGFEIRLTASATGIRPGAIVTYRDTKVGDVTAKTLSPDGKHVLLTLALDPRYSHLVCTGSRFWDACVLQIHVGFIKINIRAPIMSSINGQIQFDTPADAGSPVDAGHAFELLPAPPAK